MTRFLHLTDLHVSHPDMNDANLHSDTAGTLKRMVEIIARMDPLPDFVVASGDLTNHGDEASYELVKDTIADLPVPIVLALGNHDKREGFNKVFLGEESDTPYDHDTVLGGLHVITLDTALPGKVAGALDDEQFAYLQAALDRHPDLPKLLVLHHPPRVDPEGLPWGSLDTASTERLAATVKGYDVAGILSGHIHINRVSHWYGIPVIIGNGQHSTVDMLERKDLKIIEGTGFAYCEYRPSGLSVSFAPLTPDRRVITVIDQERLRALSLL